MPPDPTAFYGWFRPRGQRKWKLDCTGATADVAWALLHCRKESPYEESRVVLPKGFHPDPSPLPRPKRKENHGGGSTDH